jgi:probable F420-dependent oxidoreductase
MSERLRFDTNLMAVDQLQTIPDLARVAEEWGFDGIWSAETSHDPFLGLALAATSTRRVNLGTSIALSFTRSPMTLAYTCWDLAALSEGRFLLGLGTQVKAHNERRFSVPWTAPVARLREVLQGLQAIWHSWRTGEKLNFRGEYYQFTLMTPFFTPPRHAHRIPITIAGVNTGLASLAGELCDGFHVHPLHSVKYIDEVVRPAIAAGAARTGRSIDQIELIASVFIVSGITQQQVDFSREFARQQISFYASTPSYKVIFDTHSWGETAEQLSRLAARKQWGDMPSLISDEMLDTFSITAPPDQVAERVLARYGDRLGRVAYYIPFQPGQMDELWKASIHTYSGQG